VGKAITVHPRAREAKVIDKGEDLKAMKKSAWLRTSKGSSLSTHLIVALLIALGVCAMKASVGESLAAAQSRPAGPPAYWKDARELVGNRAGRDEMMQELGSSETHALSMASADFYEVDGIPSLVVGYESANGAHYALYRGNLNAFAPSDGTSWNAIARQEFLDPFQSTARVSSLPVQPDFLVAGKFAGSIHEDLVTAARGGDSVFLLGGDGAGKFASPQRLQLPGAVTAMAAGSFGEQNRFSQLLVGITTSQQQPLLLLYTGSPTGMSLLGTLSLSSPATAMELGDIDGNGRPGAVILAAGQAWILHADTMELEPLLLPVSANALALGHFHFDRHPGMQIALLANEGSIQIAARNGADQRLWTADEVKNLRGRRGRLKVAPAFASRPEGWGIVESFAGVSPNANHPRILKRLRISNNSLDDLIELGSGQMSLISHLNPKAGENHFGPAQQLFYPYSAATPVVALPMRVNVDARHGLVLLHQGSVRPWIMHPLPDPTFFVNRSDDPAPGDPNVNCNNTSATDISSSCSLRQAVMKTNAIAGNDTIMLGAGTYTLTIPGANTNDASTGHLDINDGVAIVGAGAANTIIQAGTNTSNGIDKIFSIGAPLFDGTLRPSFDTSLSGLTLQFGRNTSTQDPFGGAFDWDAGASGTGTISITGCNIVNNTDASPDAPSADGGGMFFSNEGGNTATVTISNSTIQGNTAEDAGGGIAVLPAPSVSNAISTIAMTISNSQVVNNTAVGGGHQQGGGIAILGQSNGTSFIHGSTISGNQAGAQGGGVYTNAGLQIDQGTVITGNNSSGSGGGLFVDLVSGAVTVNAATMTLNTATSSGGGIEEENSNGGSNLNMSFSRIVDNSAPAGSGLNNVAGTSGAGAVSAADNWWGCNEGPNSSPCDRISGSISLKNGANQDAWITLGAGINPGTIRVGDSATVTASVLQDNNKNAIPASTVSVMNGVGVTFSGTVNGNVTNAAGTLSGGQATANFTGTTAGNGSVTVLVDHATVNPPVTILGPIASLSPTSLSFGNQNVGSTSAPQMVTLSNTGNAPLTVSNIATSGDFAQSNNCGSSLTAGSNCIINVTFTPTATGSRTGILTVADSAPGSPHTASLSGTGTPALQSVDLTPVNTNVLVGGTVQYKFTGHYSDGSSQDLTSSATFTSSDPLIAAISAGGLATGKAVGQARIAASVPGFVQSTFLTVVAPSPTFPAGFNPVGVAFDGANIWATNPNSNTVTKLRASDGANLGTFAAGSGPYLPAFDGSNIWLPDMNGNTVTKLRASDGTKLGSFRAGTWPIAAAFDGANIWVTNFGSNTVTKLRASDGLQLGTFPTGRYPIGVAFDGGNVWVANTSDATVTKLRGSDGATLGTFAVGATPYAMTFDGANIWVTNGSSGTVTKLRASDGATLGTFSVGSGPESIAFDGTNIWVTGYYSNNVTELRASDGLNLGTLPVGSYPYGVAFDGSSIWVANSGDSTVSKVSTSAAIDFSVTPMQTSQSIAPGGNTTYTTSVMALGGFRGQVSLSVSGLPSGATASFSPASVAGSGYSALTVTIAASTTPGPYTLSIIGTSGSIQHSSTLTLNVAAFSMTPTPATQGVAQGNATTYTATITALSGFSGSVTLSVNGLPAGATASFNPPSLSGSGSSTLSVTTATSTPVGTFALTLAGTNGNIVQTANIILTVIASYPAGFGPVALISDGSNIWVADQPGNNVTKLRISDGATLGTFAVGSRPISIAFDGANVWTANYGSNNVTKLRVSDGTTLGTYNVGSGPYALAFDGVNIWAANYGSSNVTKLRASDGIVLGTFRVGPAPVSVVFDGANVWVTDSANNITKLRASDGIVLGTFSLPFNSSPLATVFDGQNIWVANFNLNSVTKLRASDGASLGTFAVATSPQGIAFDGTNIWVANSYSNNITELGASDGAVLDTINVGSYPCGVTFDGANIWVANVLSNTVSKF
jgi:YVTN family beta-propeller protein